MQDCDFVIPGQDLCSSESPRHSALMCFLGQDGYHRGLRCSTCSPAQFQPKECNAESLQYLHVIDFATVLISHEERVRIKCMAQTDLQDRKASTMNKLLLTMISRPPCQVDYISVPPHGIADGISKPQALDSKRSPFDLQQTTKANEQLFYGIDDHLWTVLGPWDKIAHSPVRDLNALSKRKQING